MTKTQPAERNVELKNTHSKASYIMRWKTSMFPKDGSYILPDKASVRKAENLEEGDEVFV